MNKMKVVLIGLVLGPLMFAQTPPPQPAIRVYTVSNPATFPSLSAGTPGMTGSNVLVFRNGVFQTTANYTILSSTTAALAWRFKSGVLQPNDQIQVVTEPYMTLGTGFVMNTTPSGSQVTLDTSFVTYRTLAPTPLMIGTACTQQAPPNGHEGTGGWAADTGNFYFCAPDGNGGFIWAAIPFNYVQPYVPVYHQGANISITPQSNDFIISAVIPPPPPPSPNSSTPIYGEIATFIAPVNGSAPSWSLLNTPVAGLVGCYQNGTRTTNFTSAANILSSQSWQATDVILCDYYPSTASVKKL